MHYDYNRAAFRSVCQATGVNSLAVAYCSCVLLELSLKQHLNLISSALNSGHDLPQLVHRLGIQHTRYQSTCNALQRQLGDALRALFSQGRGGIARSIPSNSYPHLRYLRHSSDWPSSCSSDVQIAALNSLLQRIQSLMKRQLGVAV